MRIFLAILSAFMAVTFIAVTVYFFIAVFDSRARIEHAEQDVNRLRGLKTTGLNVLLDVNKDKEKRSSLSKNDPPHTHTPFLAYWRIDLQHFPLGGGDKAKLESITLPSEATDTLGDIVAGWIVPISDFATFSRLISSNDIVINSDKSVTIRLQAAARTDANLGQSCVFQLQLLHIPPVRK